METLVKEKAIKYGLEALETNELLSIIFPSHVASQLFKLSNGNIYDLLEMNDNQLLSIENMTKNRILTLRTMHEMSKRIKPPSRKKVSCPTDIFSHVSDMQYLEQEVLRVLTLDTKNSIMQIIDVSKGTLNSSIVHPRDVFRPAVSKNSASIVVCHNHPSGDATPSTEDINITHRLKECGILLGIPLLDHLIIGGNDYVSLKEKGII